MDDGFTPVDPKELEDDINLEDRLKAYLEHWDNKDLSDVPEEVVVDGGRAQIVRAFPTAVSETIRIMKFGTKDDSTRLSAAKFIIGTIMKDPTANGEDRMGKLLRDMAN